MQFETRNTFEGLIFVQDHLADPSCRSFGTKNMNNHSRNASIKIGFKTCEIERKRSSDPRGMYLTTSLYVAFHPEFLTKIDRIYVVQCFYMEMEKILERRVQVQMNPPSLQAEQVLMPVCKYEVLDGSPTGPPVSYAVIGQMVYHKWTCETNVENQFCMVVHSCFVDDGNGDRVQLIDEQGCARDKHLLQNLEYVSDLMAGKEAHAYKYADRQSLFFDCQISLAIKEPDQEYCNIPTCSEPPRRKRENLESSNNSSTSRQQTSLIQNTASTASKKRDVLDTRFIPRNDKIIKVGWSDNVFNAYQDFICMSSLVLGTIAAVNLIMISVSALFFYDTFKHHRGE